MPDNVPTQRMGCESTEKHISSIKEMMAEMYPDCDFLGAGAEGCVFDIDGKNVIKILFPVVMWDASYEAHALKTLHESGCALAPVLTAIGHIGDYRAIIREDLRDVNAVEVDFKHDSLLHFLELTPSLLNAELDGNPALDIDGFLEERITDFFHENYTGYIDDMQEEAENNEILDVSFLKGFHSAYNYFYERGIQMLDISFDNLGFDNKGNVKIRDMSRFVSRNPVNVDFSRNLCNDVSALQNGTFSHKKECLSPSL